MMTRVADFYRIEWPAFILTSTYAIQNQFADYGACNLVGLGATAIAFAVFVPRGL